MIVVIGDSGLIGTKLVKLLRNDGLQALSASRSTGVNTLAGEGLVNALVGASVLVEVANSLSFEDRVVLEFCETAGRNFHAAEMATNVGALGCFYSRAGQSTDSSTSSRR
jgi:uncharacterized protein YbjT (DUF2867 family)